jgi:hypothetical protein
VEIKNTLKGPFQIANAAHLDQPAAGAEDACFLRESWLAGPTI